MGRYDRGDVQINGKFYRIDLASYKCDDIVDFSPRAQTPGGSIIHSELGLYQPLLQTDWRHGFGFEWYSDPQGYLNTDGSIDTRQAGVAMLFTQPTASETDNFVKEGYTTFGAYLFSYGPNGIRRYDGATWAAVNFWSPSFDAATSTTAYLSGAPWTVTVSHTTTTNPNGILVVSVEISNTNTVSGITYGGDALLLLDQHGAVTPRVEVWYKLAPKTGANDVVVTMAAAACGVVVGTVSYFHVLQVTPFRATSKTNGAGTSVSQTPASQVGDIVLDFLAKAYGAADAETVGALQTQRFLASNTVTSTVTGAGSTEPGKASTTTMSWSWTTSRAYAHLAVALQPVAYNCVVNCLLSTGGYIFAFPDGERPRKSSTGGLTGDDWTDAGADGSAVDFKWAVIHGGNVYAGKDGSARVHYDGSDDLSALEGGLADTDKIYCGAGAIPTLSALSFAGKLNVARQDGLWVQSGEANIFSRTINYSDQISSTNFRSMAIWNNFLVYPIRDKLNQWNGVRYNEITPPRISDTFPYVTYGRFDNLVVVGRFLYLTARTNEATYAEDLLCWDGTGWHKLARLVSGGAAGGTVTSMYYDAIWNRLWYHVDHPTADYTNYFQFQDLSEFPYSNFPTSGTHSLISSRLDMGFRRVRKSSPSIIVEASNLSVGARTITIYYSIDGGSWVSWGVVSADGITILNLSGSIEYYNIQIRADLATNSSASTPVLEGLTLRFIMRPEVLYGYSMRILAGKNLDFGGKTDPRTAREMRDELRTARNSKSPITFVDLWGVIHSCYVSSLQELAVERQSDEQRGLTELDMILPCNLVELG
jgi:hypothetical protein